jgi:excisionase family DNA binding protein
MEKMLRLRRVAEMTGISVWTLRRWLHEGAGPPYKKTPGGYYWFRESDVLQWLSTLDGPAQINADR